MRYVTGVAAIACALFTLHAPQVAAQSPVLQNPQIDIAYKAPANPAFKPIMDRLKQNQVLEQTKQLLAPVKLPRKFTLQFDQCGAPTRPYKAGGPATVCYETIAQIEQVAAKVDPNMATMVLVGTVVQAVLHEIADAVFDDLQVPIWGRREDAADNLAAFLMLQFGDDVAQFLISGTAVFFASSGKTWTGNQFADVNSPEAQRYFNYACMAYGSDAKTFEFLAKPADKDAQPLLPASRAPRCAGEYDEFRRAFELRIMPFVDPDLLVQVRARPWLR